MARFTLKGSPFSTTGSLPAVGTKAPAFTLVKSDLSPVNLADLVGKQVILNIFPSVDTPTCATSVRTFHKRAAEAAGSLVMSVSMDLPFALSRFCGAEGLDRVIASSAFRSTFGKDYGLTIQDGPLQGLLARAVVVIGRDGTFRYTELVPEIANEPDYKSALAASV